MSEAAVWQELPGLHEVRGEATMGEGLSKAYLSRVGEEWNRGKGPLLRGMCVKECSADVLCEGLCNGDNSSL